jgi:flagellar motility protein MotE (MotC chaperone)
MVRARLTNAGRDSLGRYRHATAVVLATILVFAPARAEETPGAGDPVAPASPEHARETPDVPLRQRGLRRDAGSHTATKKPAMKTVAADADTRARSRKVVARAPRVAIVGGGASLQPTQPKEVSRNKEKRDVPTSVVQRPPEAPRAVGAQSDAGAAKPASDANSAEIASLVKSYCTLNAPAAAEARIAWQTRELEALESRILAKSEELTRKADEVRALLKRRDESLAKANDSLVAIYAKMKPDAAAQHFASMSDEIATALLLRVDVRTASAILNEMNPERAARMAAGLATPLKKHERSGS